MKKLATFFIIFLFSLSCLGQGNRGDEKDPMMITKGPRKQLATVIYAGLGGAVIGLSTLSFHGRPQDHLNSIAGGFAIGIIIGAIYSSYSVTQDPSRLRSGENLHLQPDFESSSDRLSSADSGERPYQVSYTWEF